jgi:1,4-dihydroxy-2-naphthoyl-CoA hydrolase
MISIDAIEAARRGTLPDLLGIRLVVATPDRVTATLHVRPDLCTAGRAVHGGTLMAFADDLGAVATMLNLTTAAGTTTIESKTSFLASAKEGETLTAECLPLHRGRSTMVWRTTIRSESTGKVVADVTQTQLVLNAPTGTTAPTGT